MKVKALTSFVGHYGDNRKTIVAHEGMEFDLPPGTDWVNCGFVEPVADEQMAKEQKPRRKPRRKATQPTGEKAVRKKA